MKYKVVFIDWDGTLSNSRFWDRWKQTDKYTLIQKHLFIEGKNILKNWMQGAASSEDILYYTSKKTGILYEELKSELIHSAKTMSFINPNTLNLVNQLRATGTKVVIATDNMDTFERWTVPAMSLEKSFDGILSSSSIGALKVDTDAFGKSAFFNDYLSTNLISKHESLLIDNSLDAEIVTIFGMDFAHVNEEASLTDHLKELLY